MAGVRATASLSLMVGVALATSLVVAGILAAPIILDCSRAPGGIGACLHSRIAITGLEAVAPALPVPNDAGWLDVNATEYKPSRIPEASLSAPQGSLVAEAATASAGPIVEIALAPPPTTGTIGGGADRARTDDTSVEVSALAGRLDAIQPVAPPAPTATAELSGTRAGRIAAIAVDPPAPASPVVALSGPAGTFDATGITITGDIVSPVRLSRSAGDLNVTLLQAPAAPPAGLLLSPNPGTLEAIAAAPAAPSVAADIEASVHGAEASVPAAQESLPPGMMSATATASPPPDPPPADIKPTPIIKNDTRYPNVTVLPPPTPANSSVVFLTLN